MRVMSYLGIVLGAVWGTVGIAHPQARATASDPSSQPCAKETLKKFPEVKPGITRAGLLKLLATEGGTSTRRQRTYVSKTCNVVKVRVTFQEAGPADLGYEGTRDIVLTVSKPFLEWPVLD